MAELDGSIRIGVVLDDKKISDQMNKLDQKLAKHTQSIKTQQAKLQALQNEYSRLANLEVEPKSLKRMEADLKKVQAEAASLDEEFQRLNQVASIERQAGGKVNPETQDQIDDITEKLTYADQRADALQRRIQEVKLDPTTSDEAQKLSQQMEEARVKLEGFQREAESAGQAKAALAAEADQMREIASDAQVANQHIVELNRELVELTDRMKELKSAGVGVGYQEYDQISARVKQINAELKEYQKRTAKAQAPDASGWSRLAQTLKNGITSRLNAASAASGKLNDRIKALGRNKGFDKAGKSAQRLGKRLKSLVAGALFFNVISRGLTALSKQIGAYLTANRDFSTALGSVKSNLLTAFQPIYDRIIPALNTLMSALKQATAQMAVFTARIFGTTAQKAQKDADALKKKADALKESGEAAKKAEKEEKKYLASFDTVEKLGEKEQKEEKAEDYTGPEFDTDFSEIEPPQWLMDFWAPIKESWDQVGGETVEAVKSALGSIWDLLKAIGRTFLDMWNSAAGVELLNNLQLLLQTILGIIHDIAAAFLTAWNSGTGEEVIAALFYMLNSVLELLISVGQAFREAWNDNGRGVEICNTILQIIRNVFNIVGNLSGRFREAWEANNNGVSIWGAILDIIQDVLDFFQEITLATAEWTAGLNLEPIVSGFRALLEAVEPLVDTILGGLAWAWENILLPLAGWVIDEAVPAAINVLVKAFEALNKILEALAPVFMVLWNNILKPLASFIGTVFVGALNALAAAIEFIGNLLSGLIQTLSDAASKVSGFFGASNSAGKSGTASYGGSGRSAAPRMALAGDIAAYNLGDIPHLAQGAVISPNSEFLAVLGDQRNGVNVESPLSTIKQAVMEAIGEMGGASSGPVQVNINFTGSLAQIGRLLNPVITVEQGRLGPSLV